MTKLDIEKTLEYLLKLEYGKYIENAKHLKPDIKIASFEEFYSAMGLSCTEKVNEKSDLNTSDALRKIREIIGQTEQSQGLRIDHDFKIRHD